MPKKDLPVYYRRKFVNPEWEELQDGSRVDNSELQELYFFRKESEKRQAIISVYTTCIALDIREIDGSICSNVDWNAPEFLDLCKIAGPNRHLLNVASLLHDYGYEYMRKYEL